MSCEKNIEVGSLIYVRENHFFILRGYYIVEKIFADARGNIYYVFNRRLEDGSYIYLWDHELKRYGTVI